MTRFTQFIIAALLAFSVLAAMPHVSYAQTTKVVYVDGVNGDLDPPNLGQNGWGSGAFRFLQDALTAAQELIDDPEAPPDLVIELWLTAGTFRPDQRATYGDDAPCEPYGSCDPELFEIHSGHIEMYGGFPPDAHDTDEYPPAGATKAHRDPGQFETLLTADFYENDDVQIYDSNGDLVLQWLNNSLFDNGVGVIRSFGSAARTIVLDGLTISGAFLYAPVDVVSGNVTLDVQGCTFKQNNVDAILFWPGSGTLNVRDSEFRHNRTFDGLIYASGFNHNETEVNIVKSEFDENLGPGRAVRISQVRESTLVNVRATRNHGRGAIVFEGHPNPDMANRVGRLWNCLISDNSSTHGNAGFFTGQHFHVEALNCTLSRNTAPDIAGFRSNLTVANTIAWGSGPPAIAESGFFTLEILYSDIEGCEFIGACDGHPSNFDADPEFVDADALDYRLKGISPCIDKGNWELLPCDDHTLTCEILGEATVACAANKCNPSRQQLQPIDLSFPSVPRILNGGHGCELDIGAMEYAAGEACGCEGDIAGECGVGVADLLALLACWGQVVDPSCEPADLTESGSVGVADLLKLLEKWGPCPGENLPTVPCGPLLLALVKDCQSNYFDTIEEFEDCVLWVEEHRTPYPGP